VQTTDQLPVGSPTNGTPDSLNETARKILEAAKTIVARDGYSALTLRAINREAGVSNMGAAGYYFGSKAHVVAAIIRQAIADYSRVSFPTVSADASLEQRVNAFTESLGEYDNDSLAFFEILPHALRDEALRTYLVDEYLTYFQACVKYFFPNETLEESERQRLECLAQDVAAFQDGVILQAQILGERYDLRSAYGRLGRYLLTAAREAVIPAEMAE